MYKLIRIFNENRKQILIAILAIVFALGIIHLLNGIYKNKNQAELEKLAKQERQINTSTYNSSYSVISGKQINENINKGSIAVIDEFIKNCNEKNIEKAYSLLSTNCKEQVYPSVEFFKLYVNNNFSTKKDYTVQLWQSDSLTYKVEFTEDVMSSGKIDSTNVIQDYYTIVKENGESRLNISEFIGKFSLNKVVTQKGITISVNYKNVYKDYEIFNITIKNNSNNNILIDSNESTKNMYLVGENGIKYSAYTHELDKSDYLVKQNYKKDFNIKYAKQYMTNRKISLLVFSDIVLNSDEYEKSNDNGKYNNRLKIEVNL